MSKETSMQDLRSNMAFNVTDARGGVVAGVDTGQVDKSESMKILEYWAKEPVVD